MDGILWPVPLGKLACIWVLHKTWGASYLVAGEPLVMACILPFDSGGRGGDLAREQEGGKRSVTHVPDLAHSSPASWALISKVSRERGHLLLERGGGRGSGKARARVPRVLRNKEMPSEALSPALSPLTLICSRTKEALPFGHPGRRPPAPQPQPIRSLLKSPLWLSTRVWLRPHHRSVGHLR